MKIREIVVQDFRAFRGERRISFVDPVTDTVRPVTVLAGANGCGKTTLLDTIEAVLSFTLKLQKPSNLIKEIQKDSLVCLTVELAPQELPLEVRSTLPADNFPEIVTIAVGNMELAPHPIVDALRRTIAAMQQQRLPLHGGLLYFPYNRKLEVTRGGKISEPDLEKMLGWVFRWTPSAKWEGSLEELWTWKNYLDLESFKANGVDGRKNLASFVESVESVLGENRRITVSEGRVRVPIHWTQDGERPQVRLDQLPSGEQQVLLLFGELARRRREGAVIMIDEVENSLHPTLQRLVMWNLRRLAREWDAQVIVTTHSREIISTATGGAFINLDYPESRFDLPLSESVNGGASA